MRHLFLTCTLSALAGLAASAQPAGDEAPNPRVELVRDILTSPGANPSGGVDWMVHANGGLFFSAATPEQGRELYFRDPSGGASIRLTDIAPGDAFSHLGESVWFKGALYFVALTEDGSALWRTDGTPEGTVRLDPAAFPAPMVWGYALDGRMIDSIGELYHHLTPLEDSLVFTAYDAEHGVELWRTDGTPEGTFLLKDIRPGPASSTPRRLTELGGRVYFTAALAHGGEELFSTDGTVEGTFQVTDVYALGVTNATVDQVTASAGRLIFRVRQYGATAALWTSDGTAGGTQQLRDLHQPTVYQPDSGGLESMFSVGNGALFVDESPPRSLWFTDGTQDGTSWVMDLGDRIPGHASAVLDATNTVFWLESALTGPELWRSDGTPGGTTLLAAGLAQAAPDKARLFRSAPDGVFFVAGDPLYGRELWFTDGTAPGTRMVKDIAPGAESADIRHLVWADGRLYFGADDRLHGHELWSSDGTEADTALVEDVNAPHPGSQPRELTSWNGRLAFTAEDESGRELWLSDGTVAGTVRLVDLAPGAASSSPRALTPHGDFLYFVASTQDGGTQLWRTDGTADGTERLTDLQGADGWIDALTPFGNDLLFAAGTNYSGSIWRSDGTPNGTAALPGAPLVLRWLAQFSRLGDRLYFAAIASGGVELWSTDGTPFGSALVKDIFPGPIGSNPRSLHQAEGHLYFQAFGPSWRNGLWRTDGTAGGTVPIWEAAEGSIRSCCLGSSAEKLYFVADDGTHGAELWVIDGMSGAAQLVVDLAEGLRGSNPTLLTEAEGGILFTASTEPGTRTLWRTDGSAAGTHRVAVQAPLAAGPEYHPRFLSLGPPGPFLFTAADSERGAEPWLTFGEERTTFRWAGLAPGSRLSNPGGFTLVGDRVFFNADDRVHGDELHSVPVEDLMGLKPLTVRCPADFELGADADGAAVASYPPVEVHSRSTAEVTLTLDPAEGSALVAGAHPIAASVQDALGNTASCQFVVTVTAAPVSKQEPEPAPKAPASCGCGTTTTAPALAIPGLILLVLVGGAHRRRRISAPAPG